jgi:hypothetical protein
MVIIYSTKPYQLNTSICILNPPGLSKITAAGEQKHNKLHYLPRLIDIGF